MSTAGIINGKVHDDGGQITGLPSATTDQIPVKQGDGSWAGAAQPTGVPSGTDGQVIQYDSAGDPQAVSLTTATGITAVIAAGTDTIQAIIEGNPGTYYLAPGTHIINTAIDADQLSDVHLIGAGFGQTIIQRASDVSFILNTETTPSYYNCGNTTANSYTVTTSTAADANNFSAGDTVLIRGTWGTKVFNILDKVVSANGGTGVITVAHNISEIFTSVSVGTVNPVVNNFTMEGISFDSNNQSAQCMEIFHMEDCRVNLQMTNLGGTYSNLARFSWIYGCEFDCYAPERRTSRPEEGSGYWAWAFTKGQGGRYFAEAYEAGAIDNSPYSAQVYFTDIWRADARFNTEGGNVGINVVRGGFSIIHGQTHDQNEFGFHMDRARYSTIIGHSRGCGTAIANSSSNYKSGEVNT